MTRRLILTALVAGLLGTSGTAAFATADESETQNKRVCVMATDDPATHSWDGVCVWLPK
jgi:hypothetical protein